MSSHTSTQNPVQLSRRRSVADIHICGLCRSQFTSITNFIEHKRAGCAPVPVYMSHHSAAIPVVDAVGTSSPSAQGEVSANQRCWKTSDGNQELHSHVDTQAESASEAPDNNFDNASISSQNQDTADGMVGPSNGVSLQGKASGSRKTIPTPNQMIQSPQQQTSPSKTEKRYKCNNEGCSFTTAHLKDIQRHVRIHTGEKPYTCTYCKKGFARQDKLKIHHRIHSGDKPFQCNKCDYCSVDGGSLKKHMRIHNDERPFKCQICDYRSRNSSQLTVHLRTHTGDTPFHCQQCDSKFKINSDLNRHMRTHTGIKPFHCKLCDYKSSLKSNLNSHVKTNHQNDKRYQCEECGFACCTKRQLKQHSHGHATVKPIKCLECNFTCFNKVVFRRHERKHSDDRPYKCKHCDFDSKYPGHVPAHIKKHHPEKVKKKLHRGRRGKRKSTPVTNTESVLQVVSSKKPFQCDTCRATFMRQDSLLSHKRQHERLNNKTQESIDRESMAYAVLQLQQYSGKGAAENDDKTVNDKAIDGVTTDKPPDVLHTLLSAIESSQSNEMSVHTNSSERSSPAVEAAGNNQAVRHGLPERIEVPVLPNRQVVSSTQNESTTAIHVSKSNGENQQASDVLEVIQIAADALREVPSESHQDGNRNNDVPNSVMIIQQGPNADPNSQTITVEFQQQDIVMTQMPSTSIPQTSDTQSPPGVSRPGGEPSCPSSTSNDSTTYLQLAPQQMPETRQVVPVINNQRRSSTSNVSLQVSGATPGQSLTVPQQVFNVQIPSHFITQQAPGNLVPGQQQPMHVSSSQLRVLPVQTISNVAPKIVNFAQPIAVAHPSAILIPQQVSHQQPLQQQSQQQQGNANVPVTYTVQTPTRLSQTQSQANWQTVQYGQQLQTLLTQPVQSVYQQQIPVPVMLQQAGTTTLQQVTIPQHTATMVSSRIVQQQQQQQQHHQQQPIAIQPAQVQTSLSTAGVNAAGSKGQSGAM